MRLYCGYGLVVRSEIALQDWAATEGSWDVDVRIGQTPCGLSPSTASGARWEVSPGCVLVRVDRIGRYLITGGKEIVVTPEDGATEAELAFGLLGAAIGPLLHQRGSLVLHASAINIPGGTVALAGHSGAGKSTLLLACLRRGGSMITDDMAPLDIDRAGPHVRVSPGIPLVNAWCDAAEHFGYQPSQLTPVRARLQKFKIRPETPCPAALQPLKAIVVLEPSRRPGIRCLPVSGQAAFVAVRAQTRGLRIVEALGRASHFHRVSNVASVVPVFRLERPDGPLGSLDALVDRVYSLADR